jgi:DNA-binding NtrC family response regulator
VIVAPRVLVVEDDENTGWLLGYYLMKTFPDAECTFCHNGIEAMEFLNIRDADAIVTDSYMHPINGLGLIQWVRQRPSSIPIVMVTGDASIEAEAIKAGATMVVGVVRSAEIGEILLELLSVAPAHKSLG